MADLIALDMPPGPALVEALERHWGDGNAVMVLDQRLPAPARRSVLDEMAPAVVDDGVSLSQRPDGRPTEPGDALVVPTSGSTGRPKGVVLTHEAVAASALAGSTRLGVDASSDVWLACLPLTHLAGLGVVTKAVLTGTPLVVHDRVDPAAIRAAARHGATLTTLVPTALRRIDPTVFRRIVVGGADVGGDLPVNVVTSYGLTETCGGCVYDGIAFDGVEVRIDETDQILVRGPVLLRCYRDGHVPTDDHGWLPTGDLGALVDGRLVVRGRGDDLIISGGENIWPGPVEDAVRSLPAIREAAVVGCPDSEWGQQVVAVVEVAPGHAPPALADVREVVGAQLHPWMAPRRVVVVDALPRTRAGKVRRRGVRDLLAGAAGSEPR